MTGSSWNLLSPSRNRPILPATGGRENRIECGVGVGSWALQGWDVFGTARA